MDPDIRPCLAIPQSADLSFQLTASVVSEARVCALEGACLLLHPKRQVSTPQGKL